MAKLSLHNTLSRKKEEFHPVKGKTVGVYSCGPTVYHDVHLGNFRSFLFSDILRRVLGYNGYHVKLVMNITDVGHLTSDADTGEDKMEKSAAAKGKSAWDVARFYEKSFTKEREMLNILPPNVQPRATAHISEQIALIKKLEKGGFTYRISDGIYFDTSRFKQYGRLSRQKLSDKKGGARVRKNEEKRQPSDFALWKFSPANEKRQMEWLSPWGIGFPGWHIECSAMSVKYLGQPFDIHTGGIDHLAVHHEDEIAQSVAANGKPLAKYWMHNEFLVLKDKGEQIKMSRSLGHEFTVSWVASLGIEPLAYRYLCLTTHYRKQLEFSIPTLKAAETALHRLRESVALLPRPAKKGVKAAEEKFMMAVNDDLNTAKALSIAWELLRDKKADKAAVKKSLFLFDEVLGLDLAKKAPPQKNVKASAQVLALLKLREEARKAKKWTEGDKLRKQIEDLGFDLIDTFAGPKITKRP